MSAPPTRSDRDHDDSTRERILGAALRVFAQQGFEGARTRDIADLAHANLGLIKYYFGTKQDLWKAAVDRAFQKLAGAFGETLVASREGEERSEMARAIRAYLRFCAQHPEFVQLMNDEGRRDGPRAQWLVERHVRPIYEVMTQRVKRARAGVPGRTIPTWTLHYAVVGSTLVFSQAPECRMLTGLDPTSEEFIEAHADAVTTLLLGSSG